MHKYTTDELVAQKPAVADFLNQPRFPLYFILHNIRSLENVGLFFRLGDAIRVKKIFLTGYTGYPRLPEDGRDERIINHAENEINKTAIKLVPVVPWGQAEDPLALINPLRSAGTQIVAVEQTDISQDYREVEYQLPTALIFGHERTGVEDELLKLAHQIVHIPMLGMGNSHNVAVSGAIVANFILNQHRGEFSSPAWPNFSKPA